MAEKDYKVADMCEYAAQPLRTTYIGKNVGFKPEQKLKVEVRTIRMDYPFNVENGEVYIIRRSNTWGALIRQIVRTFQREYNAGKNITFHGLDDFIIERVAVWPDGMADVYIGS